jgi:ATP-dependent DNA ligase
MSDTKLFENDEEFVLKSGSTPRVAVEKKVDGLRLVLFYSEGKIRIFTDSGNWVEDSLPDLVEEVKKIKHPVSSFCWDGELELWIDGIDRVRRSLLFCIGRRRFPVRL